MHAGLDATMVVVVLHVGDVTLQVLLVEDDDDVRDMLTTMLELDGLEVLPVASAHDALAMLQVWQADVLITDVSLPGVNGLTLLERLHAERPALPVIVLTASARPGDRERAEAEGVVAYLIKPAERAVLREAIHRAAALARAQLLATRPT
jgi:CheY-like chemotaxis protein